MEIDISIDGEDVRLSAPPGTPLGDVLLPAGGPLWLGPRPLPPHVSVEEGVLRVGAVLTSRPTREEPVGALTLHVVGGPAAGLVVPVGRRPVTIGRDPSCTVVLADDRCSRTHARVEMSSGGAVVRDLGSTNGTTIDGAPVTGAAADLRPGQQLLVGDSTLTLSGTASPAATIVPAGATLRVTRSPRARAPVPEDEIVRPQPPREPPPRRVGWVTALLPAAFGAALAWALHAPQFLLFALLSPVMAVSGSLGDRRQGRRDARRERSAYALAAAETDARIDRGLALEAVARRINAPGPAETLTIALGPGSRLWERTRDDPDFLQVRLGTGASDSRLRTRLGTVTGPAGRIAGAPLLVDLRSGPLGVAGPMAAVRTHGFWLLTQLAVLHSPTDLDVVLALAPAVEHHWRWARWLPHVRLPPQDGAGVADELEAVLAARRAARNPGPWTGRWTLVLLDTPEVETLARALTDAAGLGIAMVCLAPEPTTLSAVCRTVATLGGDTGSRVGLRDGPDALTERVSAVWAERVSRALAPLVDAGAADAHLPRTCTLAALLGLAEPDAAAVAARWRGSSGRPDTVLGVAAGHVLRCDLEADGPHALVAGTTGSGKSELLQSLVFGLALDHPPDEITFLLVDYKGGAAFAPCAPLPHTVGVVTDLDPRLTRRALRSLDAELRRRERLLAHAGAADLAAYRATAAAGSLPRLVIVVDEFATLTADLPEFVPGLVSVARRGRSLGVHLVLATQRPGTAVTPEIRANTTLRIALRVTATAESADVVDVPDAALIDPSCPGRGVLRRGGDPVPFQAARAVDEQAQGPPSMALLGPWRQPVAESEVRSTADRVPWIERAVRAAREAAAAHEIGAAAPWLPPLPARLVPEDLSRSADPRVVRIGLVDLPSSQAQHPVELELGTGTSLLVVGAPGSGRTTALSVVARGAAAHLDAADLEIYVVDGAGPLSAGASMPHVVTALGPGSLELAPRLLERLVGEAPGPGRLRLLLADAWDSTLAALDETIAARCSELLATLVRDGRACGVTTVVAGDRTLLNPRLAGGFGERLLLRLSDRADYALAGVPSDAVPESSPPGRGVRASDAAEFQLALSAPGAAITAGRPAAADAIRIRPLPRRVALSQLTARAGRITIGVGGDTAEPVALALDPPLRLLLAGPPRSGRSTALVTILHEAVRLGLSPVVAAPARSPLARSANASGLRVLAPSDAPVGCAGADLLLIDDGDAFAAGPVGEELAPWVDQAPVGAIVAARSDEVATCFRGPVAEVRRHRSGILLRPGPLDGELLGVRLARATAVAPPGRGVLVGVASDLGDGEPLPVQIATVPDAVR